MRPPRKVRHVTENIMVDMHWLDAASVDLRNAEP